MPVKVWSEAVDLRKTVYRPGPNCHTFCSSTPRGLSAIALHERRLNPTGIPPNLTLFHKPNRDDSLAETIHRKLVANFKAQFFPCRPDRDVMGYMGSPFL